MRTLRMDNKRRISKLFLKFNEVKATRKPRIVFLANVHPDAASYHLSGGVGRPQQQGRDGDSDMIPR